jgi:hypothetical protein
MHIISTETIVHLYQCTSMNYAHYSPYLLVYT